MADGLFEITIFGRKRDVTYLVGAFVIIVTLGFVIWTALTMPMQ